MRSILLMTTIATAAAAPAGCAALRSPQVRSKDVHVQREERQQEAIEDYERRRNEAELQAARIRSEQGDLSGCAAAVESVLRRDPNNREARLLMADVHLARENTAAAERLLRGLVQEDASDPRAQHALALLLESTGRTGDAQSLFQQASALAPHEPLYAISRPVCTGAAGCNGPGEATAPSQAKQQPARTQRASPPESLSAAAQSAPAREKLTQSLELLAAANDAGAAGAMLAAMELEPNNRRLPLEFSIHALRTGHAAAASIVLKDAARRFPDSAEILRALGAAHLEGGNPHAAQVVLQQALSLDNADALSYFLLGIALRQQGQTRQADQAQAQAQRLDRRYPPR